MTDKVLGFEYRHGTYCLSQANQDDDAIVIKEYAHLADGTRIPRVRILENYERSFYLTKPAFQDHKDKLEYEDIDKVTKYMSTQRKLPQAINQKLGRYGSVRDLRSVCRSPYVYGADIGTGPILNYNYKKKWPALVGNPGKVAAYDIETDVVNGTNDIILASVTCGDKVICSINRSWIGHGIDLENKIKARVDELLAEHIKDRNITIEYKILENEGAVANICFERAHQWMPDFISIWNMNFDLPITIRALEKYGYDTADVFSDPSVPKQYRFFKYKEGPKTKKTQSGKVTSLHFADRWHVATCPASFYFLDSMCLYKRIRTARGNVSSYSLDAALTRHLNMTKLKFDVGEYKTMLEWHYKMQSEHKFEYIAYNIFDCIGLELLDEKTGDISRAFGGLSGVSDYGNFNKNPRRIVDDLHFYAMEYGRVIATTGDQVTDELDKLVVNMKDWIVTLGSYLIDDNGVAMISDIPTLISMIYTHLADLDVEGTYPTLEAILNISKETTHMEFVRGKDISDEERRMIGINLTGGKSNAVELCNVIYKAPTPMELLDMYRSENPKV